MVTTHFYGAHIHLAICSQYANGVEYNGVTHATTNNVSAVDCADCLDMLNV